ncbi:MAG: hypothetical protein E7260_03020 [Lachnospiraceae bacterium]|nr:hypothetical protein [Lachnospiraceae bacterium]
MGREDKVESENKAESNTESGTEGPWLSVFLFMNVGRKVVRSRQILTRGMGKYGRIWYNDERWEKEDAGENERMPRQQVAFGEKSRKIKGCGSLREDFYTKFKPKN